MSITISTDVFCDNFEDDCSQWVPGDTGSRVKARSARRNAKRHGWVFKAGRDLCPTCAAALSPPGEVESTGAKGEGGL